MLTNQFKIFSAAAVLAGMIACGSGEDEKINLNINTFTIGGTVSGLNGSVVIQNNGADRLTLTTNGVFTFSQGVDKLYDVTVVSSPSNQTCEVVNGTGEASADVTNVAINCNFRSKMIFLTAESVTGDLDSRDGVKDGNGIEEADKVCNQDQNKPNSGSYKALLGHGIDRTIGHSIIGFTFPEADWPLLANEEYIRPDGTIIGTTNDKKIFDFDLVNSFVDSAPLNLIWTGLSETWLPSKNCSLWTTDEASEKGNMGFATKKDDSALVFFEAFCNATLPIICIEQ